jgi:hypothetical protein
MPDDKPEAKPFLPPGMREPRDVANDEDNYEARPYVRDALAARDDAWRQELAREREEAVAAYRERVVAWLLDREGESVARDFIDDDDVWPGYRARARALIQEVRR